LIKSGTCVAPATRQDTMRDLLGEFIAAVTDEVMPFVRDLSRLYLDVLTFLCRAVDSWLASG
jgi:hypothetical protein